MSQDLCRCCGNTSLVVYVLVILFGVASWVDINGLWVELPILVQRLPEGWDLPSYMAVIIQVANVAPLVYTITSSIWPHRRIEVPVIYVIISVGTVSCLLLAFFWDKTSSIAGTEHSTYLLSLQFFLALVDCTSSVAFLPFMSLFKSQYMIAYFIGEGFSGLIPSLVSLGQGAGSMECVKSSWGNHSAVLNTSTGNDIPITISFNASLSFSNGTLTEPVASAATSSYPVYQSPRFTVMTFFLVLMGLLVLSLLSFTLLNYWSYCKKEYVRNADVYISTDEDKSPCQDGEPDMTSALTPMTGYSCSPHDCHGTGKVQDSNSRNPIIFKMMSLDSDSFSNHSSQRKAMIYNPKQDSKHTCCHGGASKKTRYKPRDLETQTGSSTSFSGSSSTDSDSENLKKQTKKISKAKYALFMFLVAWINALMCGVLPSIQTYSCLPYGIRPYHLSVTLASISNPVACFAALFLKMKSTKATLLITILSSALSGYLLLTAASSPSPPLVDHYSGGLLVVLSWVVVVFFLTYTKVCIGMVFRKEGRKALLWVGAFTQVGALVGALTIFFIINYYKLFQWANPCL